MDCGGELRAADTAAPPPRREGALSLILLLASALITVAFISWLPSSMPGWLFGLLVGTVVVLALVRLQLQRAVQGSPTWRTWYWINAVCLVGAVLVSPFFGLYGFIGYYEGARLPGRQPYLATVATATAMSIAQAGGPYSPIFTPLIVLAFFTINIVIASFMLTLDRQRDQLMSDLHATNAELRAEQTRSAHLRDQLVAQARQAGERDERSRLSREIHDTVAQDLVAIITQLDLVTDAPDPAERDRRLGLATTAAHEALAEARRAVHALSSPRLDHAGLAPAIEELVDEWRNATGTTAELRVSGDARPTMHDDALLRVCQESLSNVARHARAGRVDVLLDYSPDAVSLTVIDDGAGFDPAVGRGHGLPGMRQRMAAAGGELDVDSRPGEGTVLRARVPLQEEET